MITATTTHYKLETKTKYKETSRHCEEITEETYNNLCSYETLSFFRKLGGSETAQTRFINHRSKITKLISKSPDKYFKTVREFQFS